MAKILVSACLLGFNTRYDGKSITNQKILDLLNNPDNIIIPVCPEQLGGLSTPRSPSEIIGDKLINKDGIDVTSNYNNGANITLEIAKINKVDYCILKQKSPSCGFGKIYDGSFSGKLIDGNGVTAKLLIDNGFKVYSDEEF